MPSERRGDGARGRRTANGIVERIHQTLTQIVRTFDVRDKNDVDQRFEFEGILSAARRAINSTVHTTLRATPTQLVFGRDAHLNVRFEADWQLIKARKQARIVQNNKRENKFRLQHEYAVGDRVMIKQNPNRKHGEPQNKGPYTVSQINDNGTVQLRKDAANGGAVFQTWNIRNLIPSKA